VLYWGSGGNGEYEQCLHSWSSMLPHTLYVLTFIMPIKPWGGIG
jgi:hypothetical protein